MKLQFKHQPFQAEAADAVCDVFCGQPYRTVTYRRDLGDLTGVQISTYDTEVGFRNQPLVPELTNRKLLDNLRAVQRRNGLKPSDELTGPGVNLSIEMETGTGKTYTYVKTMYELNKRYGWSKFIIVVPSVAIREGVYKSLQTTQEHFAGEYNKKIRFFIYNSDRLTEVDRFASDSAINVMIINMQAFNSSKNQRIIDKKLDTFHSRKPIDIIAKTNPILIIDEPQSVEGKQTKESLKKFQPLFTLRYSATHKEKYDMVYRLDALDAYNQHLVKKIAALGVTLEGSTATNGYVYCEGIDLYKDKAPTARLGFEVKGAAGTRTVVRKVSGGDSLYELSEGLAEYADGYRILPNGIDGRDNSVTFLNGLKITFAVTIGALILGVIIGLLIAVVRTAHDSRRMGKSNIILSILNAVCKLYLTVIRGTPMMVQLLIMGFVIMVPKDDTARLVCGIVTLGINSGAYVAEIVRGGLMSVNPGQMEAGRSLGLNYAQTMRLIVIPQAIKNILPALGNEMITLLKDTSLVSVIALRDVTKQAQNIVSNTYQAYVPYVSLAIIYLVLVIILTKLLGIFERRLRESDRR